MFISYDISFIGPMMPSPQPAPQYQLQPIRRHGRTDKQNIDTRLHSARN